MIAGPRAPPALHPRHASCFPPSCNPSALFQCEGRVSRQRSPASAFPTERWTQYVIARRS